MRNTEQKNYVCLAVVLIAAAICGAVVAAVVFLPGRGPTVCRYPAPGNLEITGADVYLLDWFGPPLAPPDNATVDVVYPVVQNLSDATLMMRGVYARVLFGDNAVEIVQENRISSPGWSGKFGVWASMRWFDATDGAFAARYAGPVIYKGENYTVRAELYLVGDNVFTYSEMLRGAGVLLVENTFVYSYPSSGENF